MKHRTTFWWALAGVVTWSAVVLLGVQLWTGSARGDGSRSPSDYYPYSNPQPAYRRTLIVLGGIETGQVAVFTDRSGQYVRGSNIEVMASIAALASNAETRAALDAEALDRAAGDAGRLSITGGVLSAGATLWCTNSATDWYPAGWWLSHAGVQGRMTDGEAAPYYSLYSNGVDGYHSTYGEWGVTMGPDAMFLRWGAPGIGSAAYFRDGEPWGYYVASEDYADGVTSSVPAQIAAECGATSTADRAYALALVTASAWTVDDRLYTTAGQYVWTNPPGAVLVHVYMIDGGAGGGSGGRGTTYDGGGGGGGGGSRWCATFPAALCSVSQTVTVGAGGVGGVARTGDGVGQAGSSGGASSFGSLLAGVSPTGGNPGSTAAASGGNIGVPSPTESMGARGGTGDDDAAGGAAYRTMFAGGGGGGGGGCNGGAGQYAGGDGSGRVTLTSQLAGGGTGGAVTADGSAGTAGSTACYCIVGGDGGGGGGGANGAGVNGGTGGTGGWPGSGGGGGGASATGNSGKGGDGAHGCVRVVTYCQP